MAIMFLAVDSVTDPELFAEYQAGTAPILSEHRWELVAYDAAARPLERVDGPRRVVAIKFPDEDAWRRFYDSPEYQAVIGKRLGSTEGFAVLVNVPD